MSERRKLVVLDRLGRIEVSFSLALSLLLLLTYFQSLDQGLRDLCVK